MNRYFPLEAGASLGAAFGPPLETPTIAGRSTRSPIVQPVWTTWETVPDGTVSSGASKIAWCRLGSNFSTLGIEPLDPVAAERRFEVAAGQFDAFDHRPDRGIGARAGFRRQMLERPRQIVDHRQHVAGEARHSISLGVGDLALGAPARRFSISARVRRTRSFNWLFSAFSASITAEASRSVSARAARPPARASPRRVRRWRHSWFHKPHQNSRWISGLTRQKSSARKNENPPGPQRSVNLPRSPPANAA